MLRRLVHRLISNHPATLRIAWGPRLWLAATLCLLGPQSAAQDTPETNQPTNEKPATHRSYADLASRLRTLIRQSDLSNEVGVAVMDSSGTLVFEHQGHEPRNPASNMKLLTAAAALQHLGSEFQMVTGLYGRVDNHRVEQLTLRGFGDPRLSYTDLLDLANELVDRGVQRVGTILVDGSYFDAHYLPPAFDQQPDEAATFRAPVSAVAVDRNTYAMRVLPSDEVDAIAHVRLTGQGYFKVENAIRTVKDGRLNIVASQNPAKGKLALRLSGTVPAGIVGVTYRRRVEEPLPYAGHALVDALRTLGIRTEGKVREGLAPQDSALLGSHPSAPIRELLPELGKHSDNFVAETLIKVLGAEQQRPGTFGRGVECLQSLLTDLGIPASDFEIVNGSGLFEGNRVAPIHFTRLLVYMYQQASVRSDYVSHLAIGGVDGTLQRRLQSLSKSRTVRAKTGTLSSVIGLSGYVLGPEPERMLAFSILANDVRGRLGSARRLADALVEVMASTLWPEG